MKPELERKCCVLLKKVTAKFCVQNERLAVEFIYLFIYF